MILIKVKKNDVNKKLKDFLLEQFKEQLSSSKISKSIDSGDIKVNNKKSSWNYEIKENDEVKIYLKIKLNQKNDLDFLQAKDELKVIYEDKNIIVVYKPRGLVCQKDQNEKFDTLNNRIKKYLYFKDDDSFKDCHIVHRLDKYTIGLCMAGKNKETIKTLNEIWNTEQINKFYKCLSLGYFKEKEKLLVNYIKENEEKGIMEIDNENLFNKKIITFYKVIEQYKNYALLDVEIKTGKKHQIRVHLASINHPILGDTKYNKINNLEYKYPCLVAYKIKFNIEKKLSLSYLNKKEIILDKYTFK